MPDGHEPDLHLRVVEVPALPVSIAGGIDVDRWRAVVAVAPDAYPTEAALRDAVQGMERRLRDRASKQGRRRYD